MLLDIYPHNSLDDVMSQIAEREVLKCLTYLALEQQVAKGLSSIEQLLYGIPCLTILRTFARNFSNIDFFLKILPLKDDELAMSEM